jgi:hypothetical protein
LFHRDGIVVGEFLAHPALIFHVVGLGKVMRQPKARCIAVATSNSRISVVTIAHAVIGTVATKSASTQELTTSMKFQATKRPGFLLDIDSMLFVLSTKKK